ncbi:hypothetical protein [Sphingomonas sp. Root710]|uniref:hypothetical protein n=1 Tax=Sphingomonas sp. Root710 TaxID=1736594 RepID=UPI0012E3A700|nr:hypothetical protein [Sphingomonas sp. Root710]
MLVWTNVGGLAGALLLGFLTWRIPIRTLVIAAMIGAVVMVTAFGQGQSTLASLS